MTKFIAGAVALLLIIGLGYGNFRYAGALAESRSETQDAIDAGKAQAAVSARAIIFAEEKQLAADSAAARAQKSAARARALAAKVQTTAVPDTCLPAVTEAMEAFDAMSLAFQDEFEARTELQAAVDTLVPALIAERATSARLRASASKLVTATRESFWSRLKPDIGVGGAAGIDPVTMKPSKTIGVTLSWKI